MLLRHFENLSRPDKAAPPIKAGSAYSLRHTLANAHLRGSQSGKPTLSSRAEKRKRQRTTLHIAASSGSYAIPNEPGGHSAEIGEEEFGGNVDFGGAVVNVLNILSGVGLLSVPYALKKAGWAGLGVLWLLGIVTNYTGKILVQSCREVAARMKAKDRNADISNVGYEDIGEAAFGAFGRKLVSTTVYTELLGICALLFILEGENMFKLFGTTLAPSADIYILIAAACMIPTVWLPDLKALSFLGVFGFGASLTVASTVAYTFFSKRFAAGALTQAVSWTQIPVVFGVLAFVYAGHGVFPAIATSMRKPRDFPKVLDTAYVIVAIMCTFLGVSGYIMYGSNVLDVITFNLPQGVPSTLCASIILINPIAKLALTMEPVAAAATSALKSRTQGMSDQVRRILVRTGMAFACLGTACCVPFLALVMSLIGSLLTIGSSIILPVAIHTKIFQDQLSKRQLAWNAFVITIGIGCAASGTASSLQAIVKQATA